MACTKEQARVDDLVQRHLEAQGDCKDGIRSQCALAGSLVRQLVIARAALQDCLNLPPVVQPPVVQPPVVQPPERCVAERERVQELEGQHADAKEDCNQGIKGQCGRAAPLFRQLTTARQALQRCLDLPIRSGSLSPRYLVTNLIYCPPGIGSEASYGVGSTAGITTDVTRSFKAGADLSATAEVLGVGVEVSLGIKGGVKSGTSFEVSKEASSGLILESEIDGVDHSRDRFIIWTNVQVNIDEYSDGRITVSLGLAGPDSLDLVSLTVAQLRDPSLIPDDKKNKIANLTPEDFLNILKLHPLLAGDFVDPTRFRKIDTTLQVSGPDQPGDGPLFLTKKLSNTKATGLINGTSQELTVGLGLVTGPDFLGLLKAELKASLTWEWSYETETNITAGRTEEAEAKLGSSTVGYNEVIDIYEDTMFKVFAFVSKSGRVPSESAMISGVVTDNAQLPIANQTVTVIREDGEAQMAVTNAQGVYRIFGISEGKLRIEVAGAAAEEVSLISQEPIELSFRIDGDR